MQNAKLEVRIQKMEAELEELRSQRKKHLKHYRGVIHEDASSEYKYIRLKILQDRIRNLELALEELKAAT